MYSQKPHTVLIKILDNLRCTVMKMPEPVLVEVVIMGLFSALIPSPTPDV